MRFGQKDRELHPSPANSCSSSVIMTVSSISSNSVTMLQFMSWYLSPTYDRMQPRPCRIIWALAAENTLATWSGSACLLAIVDDSNSDTETSGGEKTSLFCFSWNGNPSDTNDSIDYRRVTYHIVLDVQETRQMTQQSVHVRMERRAHHADEIARRTIIIAYFNHVVGS